jgi:hypothetical protein
VEGTIKAIDMSKCQEEIRKIVEGLPKGAQ